MKKTPGCNIFSFDFKKIIKKITTRYGINLRKEGLNYS